MFLLDPEGRGSRDVGTSPNVQVWSIIHGQLRDRDEGLPSVESHGGVQLLVLVPRHFRSADPIRVAAANKSVDSTTPIDVALEPKNSVLGFELCSLFRKKRVRVVTKSWQKTAGYEEMNTMPSRKNTASRMFSSRP